MRVFGDADGIKIGEIFPSRKELANAGIHKPTQAGISGSAQSGADSIVVSGGYEDDEDMGGVIIYTGEGGRDLSTGKQIADQDLTGRNLALSKNSITGQPVRVVRKIPKEGYRYDGLFRVVDYSFTTGKSGYGIYRFRLEKIPRDSDATGGEITPNQPERTARLVQRIIRDSKVGISVKEKHGYKCQVCQVQLETPSGPYAESAHIKPLGEPHNGPDTSDNILCLCPNHHVLFDNKAFTISDDLSLIGIDGKLHTHPRHTINKEYLRYHRSQCKTLG